LRLTEQMFDILKLNLQGLSPYKIARKLTMDPPSVYISLKAAKTNFAEADKMLADLKALGWPDRLNEVEQAIRSRSAITRKIVLEQMPEPEQEIAFKMG